MTTRNVRKVAEYPPLSSYKLCKDCGCPMLRKGQKRQHPDDYRHARFCPAEFVKEKTK